MEEILDWADDIQFAARIVRKLLGEMNVREDFDELENIGALALCECRRRFDRSLGVSFKSFAYLRIRGAVLDELRRRYRWKSWERQERVVSGEESDYASGEIECAVSPLPSPLEYCEQGELRALLVRLVSGLTSNEREVIQLLYFSDCSAEEASPHLGGRSKSWISRYHRDALLSLQLILRDRSRRASKAA